MPDRPLASYRRKRDFSTSPEPAGTIPPARSDQLRYCIQKHLASHLHYDFRLEHRGVLLSWAVPKGPSLDPAVKRLAIQVEDHPLDYASFEGVIPAGYGAGVVLVWDQGSWTPTSADVDQALEKGHLAFTLAGRKLQGAWNLVRTGRPAGKAWLLIKHPDRWASSEDITATKPLSVLGRRRADLAEVLARERKEPWPDALPVRSGATGAAFRSIVERARTLRQRPGRSRSG